MDINNIFYYDATSEQIVYSDSPPGEFSVEQMIKGMPPFMQSRSCTKKLPKTIILSDWTMSQRAPQDVKKIYTEMKTLRNMGFKIYVYSDNQLSPLKKINSLQLHGNPELTSIIREQVSRQLKIQKNKIFIISPEVVNNIIAGIDLNPGVEKIFSNMISYFEYKEIENFFSKDECEIISNEFPETPILKTIKSINQNIKINTFIEKVCLTSKQDITDFKEMCEKNGPIVSIKNLSIQSCDENDLNNILHFCPNLEELTIRWYKFGNEKYTPPELPKLKKIYLSNCINVNSALKFLFGTKKNINHINITNSNNAEEFFLEKDQISNLTHLESLCLTGIKISSENLNDVINNASNLNTLLLDCSAISRLDLSSIKNLIAVNTNKTGNIKSKKNIFLSLSNIKDTYFFKPDLFKGVKHLNLSFDKQRVFTSDDVERIISSLKECESLCIFNLQLKSDEKNVDLSQHDLSKIKKVNLWRIDCKLKHCMLERLTGLKSISGNFNDQDLIAIKSYEFPNLKNFEYWGDECSNPELQKMIQRFPNIRGPQIDDLFTSPSRPSDTISKEEIAAPTEEINNSRPVDLDTEFRPKTKLDARQYIFSVNANQLPPAVNDYRLEVYDDLQLNESNINNPFILGHKEPVQLTLLKNGQITPYDPIDAKAIAAKDPNFTYYIGKKHLLARGKWQPLPSLSAQEVITHYNVEPKGQNVEFAYSASENLYYARLSGEGREQVELNYLFKEPVQKNALLKEIQEWITYLLDFFYKSKNFDALKKIKKNAMYCNNFISGSIDVKYNATAAEKLEALVTQGKGVCRHRAVAFKELMRRECPELPVRIINNDCHAFVEIKIGKTWSVFDLGGGPAELFIDGKPANEKMWANGRNQHWQGLFGMLSAILLNLLKVSALPLGGGIALAGAAMSACSIAAKWLSNSLSLQQQAKAEPLLAQEKDISHCIKQLKTWKAKDQTRNSLADICTSLLESKQKKQLLKISARGGVQAAALLLQKQCQERGCPIFYADTPQDLVCAASSVIRLPDDRGKAVKKPAGPLYNFLEQYRGKKPHPLLIINYANFDAEDVVRFNSLLDKKALVDGVPLGRKTRVIGLMDPQKQGSYRGADFFSRFDEVKESHIATSQESLFSLPVKSVNELDRAEEGKEEKKCVINLYHATDWKERLLGRWEIRSDGLRFVQGPLVAALTSGMAIEMRNAPWEDPAFQMFWKQALLHRSINSYGKSIAVPENLKLLRSEGYEWESLSKQIAWEGGTKKEAKPLNRTTFSRFFCRYKRLTDTNQLFIKPGILEKHRGETVPILVTAAIDSDAWAALLAECQKWSVKLVAYVAEGVEISEEVKKQKIDFSSTSVKIWQREVINEKTAFLQSNDIDTSIDMLPEKESWQVIDISESRNANLLIRNKGFFNEEEGAYFLEQQPLYLLKALDEGKHVLLKGNFSQKLIEELTSFLLKRQSDSNAKGKLLLLSEKKAFSFLDTHYTHTVTAEEKFRLLFPKPKEEAIGNSLHLLKGESYSRLKARISHLRAFPSSTSDLFGEEAWQGMVKQLPGLKERSYTLTESKKIAQECDEKRLRAVKSMLEHSPYAFLTGITGVGKSTFIEEVLEKQPNLALFKGLAKMKKWANDSSEGEKILFLDEANLSERQWSEFEGLFQDPPGILIDGVYYPLSKSHKVIFAGNPTSYGDERSLASLFLRHGGSVLFDPLPVEYVYERILKPVFAGPFMEGREEEVEGLCRPFLDMYLFLCQKSQNEVLIAPRELQMMALFTLSYLNSSDGQQGNRAARHYAYEIGKNLVTQSDREEFDTLFLPKVPLPPIARQKGEKDTEFLLTQSRRAVQQQLEDFLRLREFRRSAAAINNNQKWGGIGGMILEGEPGCGKSEIVTTTLRQHGLLEGKDFFRMPVSLSLSEKEETLIKAFDQGAIVVVDEINSAPMMEQLMNALLTGRTLQGKRPNRPGFMILGTQNPATMDGRRTASTALARRLLTSVLPPYSKEEMLKILAHLGVEEKVASQLVGAYEKYQAKAQKQRLEPSPTFRDLLRVAEEVREKPVSSAVPVPLEEFFSEDVLDLTQTIKEGIKSFFKLFS